MSSSIWPLQLHGSGWGRGEAVSAFPDGSLAAAGLFSGEQEIGTIQLNGGSTNSLYVAKINQAGIAAWAIQFDGDTIDPSVDLVALPDGAVLVAGEFGGEIAIKNQSLHSENGSVFVAKLSEKGELAWLRQVRGSWAGDTRLDFSIAAWEDSSYLISGGDPIQNSMDKMLSKYDADGQLQWTQQIPYHATRTIDLAVLKDGSSLIVGTFTSSNVPTTFGHITLQSENSDIYIAKLDEDGNYEWVTKAGGEINDVGHAIAVHDDGSILISGYYTKEASFGSHSIKTTADTHFEQGIFAAGLIANGSFEWATRIDQSDSRWEATDVITRPDGSSVVLGNLKNIVDVAGIPYGSAGEYNPFLAKLDRYGVLEWKVEAGGKSNDKAYALTASDDGTLYITGEVTGRPSDEAFFGQTPVITTGTTDAFIAALSADGEWIETAVQPGTTPVVDSEGDIAEDNELDSDVNVVEVSDSLDPFLLPDQIADARLGPDAQTKLIGNASANELSGNRHNNDLDGASGDDTLLGGDGPDILRGGEGDDHLKGGLGDDVIQGGEGLDFAHFNGRFEDYKISGTKDEYIVIDTVDGGDGVDRLSEVEFLVFKGLAVTQIGLEAIVDDGSEATSLRIDSRNDIDDDDVINPLSDGLIIATSALAIEVAAGDEFAPATFDSNIVDKLTNPEGARSKAALVKKHLQELITNESLDHNANQMLDIHDAEHFIRSAMGTYPGQALTTGCSENPTNLIGIAEQIAALEADPVFA